MIMLFRKIVPVALILALLSAICPAPALALSTAGEVAIGRGYDQQIVESSVIETDPLLNAWVQSVSGKLWAQTARKDVPYSIKILDVSDVNAFSTLGGSPGRCFLNSSISAPSSERVTSVSESIVLRM